MTSAFRVALIFIACASLSVAEEEITRAFTGAKIFPITGDPIDSGTLIVRGSTIIAVGKDEATEIPEGAVTVDVSGKVMMPGLICTHSHIGREPVA